MAPLTNKINFSLAAITPGATHAAQITLKNFIHIQYHKKIYETAANQELDIHYYNHCNGNNIWEIKIARLAHLIWRSQGWMV